MWSSVYGFIISHQEIIENEERRRRNGEAPTLDCEICKGGGFVHPVIGERILWGEAMPCPECMPIACERYKYNKANPQVEEKKDFKKR